MLTEKCIYQCDDCNTFLHDKLCYAKQENVFLYSDVLHVKHEQISKFGPCVLFLCRPRCWVFGKTQPENLHSRCDKSTEQRCSEEQFCLLGNGQTKRLSETNNWTENDCQICGKRKRKSWKKIFQKFHTFSTGHDNLYTKRVWTKVLSGGGQCLKTVLCVSLRAGCDPGILSITSRAYLLSCRPAARSFCSNL